MSAHFLVINHESYDPSTVFGIFDTFEAARKHMETEAAKPDAYSNANFAEIEEWDGGRQTANYARDYRSPLVWNERRYAATTEGSQA